MSRHRAGDVVLGLDVGIRAVTCAALSTGGQGQAVLMTLPVPQRKGEDGRAVVDPLDLLAACDEALRSCAARADGRVAAVGLSASSCGVVGLDRAGRPLTGIATRPDPRTVELATGLRRMPVGLHLLRATGRPVDPGCPLAALMRWQDQDPELCGRVRFWSDLKGLVVHHLTGTLLTDRSSAAASGLLDLAHQDWHEGALELAGVTREQLPRPVEVDTVLEIGPATLGRADLPPGTPVVAGAAHHASEVLGVAAAPEQAVLTLTSRDGRLHAVGVGEPPGPACEGLSWSAPWGERWLLGGTLGSCGGPRGRAGELFAPAGGAPPAGDPALSRSGDRLLSRAGRTPPGADGLVVLPHLPDDTVPVWEGSVPGAVLGLRPHHRAEHLVRAVLEARALQTSAMLDEVVRHTEVRSVVAHGPHLGHRWQLRTLAAVLDRPVHLDAGPRPAAVGAAALALHGTGAPSPEAGRTALPGSAARRVRVEPDPVLVALYTDRRLGLADLVEGVTAAARRLSRPDPDGRLHRRLA